MATRVSVGWSPLVSVGGVGLGVVGGVCVVLCLGVLGPVRCEAEYSYHAQSICEISKDAKKKKVQNSKMLQELHQNRGQHKITGYSSKNMTSARTFFIYRDPSPPTNWIGAPPFTAWHK